VLRDIHAAAAPPWWPPAPGWWLVLGALALVVGAALWLRARRRRRERAIARLFDDALAQADTPAAQLAAISELLRRAARRRAPDADRLQGEEWLRFLDAGLAKPVFADGGALLHEGPFRRDVTDEDVARIRNAARARFIEWMRAKPAAGAGTKR
jgi:hypothetical protein